MRTLKEILSELNSLLDYDKKIERKKSELNRMRKRVQFLTVCRNYMEKEPSEEFLKECLLKKERRLKLIGDGFKDFSQTYSGKDAMKEYEKINDTKTIKEHIRSLRFLLN
jgi:hypothetical protein